MKSPVKNTAAILLLCVVIFQFGCNSNTETSVATSATVEELGQMNRDFAKALTDHDAVAAANLYDVNASLLPPTNRLLPVEPIFSNTGRALLMRA